MTRAVGGREGCIQIQAHQFGLLNLLLNSLHGQLLRQIVILVSLGFFLFSLKGLSIATNELDGQSLLHQLLERKNTPSLS